MRDGVTKVRQGCAPLNPPPPPHFSPGTCSQDKKQSVTLPAMDVIDFIKERVRKEDFLTLKMDIEAAEYQLIPAMIERQLFEYVDEFFCEFHFAELHHHFPRMAAAHNRAESIRLLTSLRNMGVYAHEWF